MFAGPSRASWVLALTALAGCVDGRLPTDVEMAEAVTVLARPVFAAQRASGERAGLTRARAVARDSATGVALATVIREIDPSATQWTLDLSFEIQVSKPPTVRLEAELLGADGGVEEVEWSGRTAPFRVRVSVETEVRELSLFRGPLSNLDLTELRVTAAPTSLLEGASAALTVHLGGASGARAYFESLDATIATVDREGRVRGLSPGQARVAALAGRLADTVSIRVERVQLPEPEEIQQQVAPQMEYTGSEIAGTMEDPAGAQAIAATLNGLGAALGSGNGAAAVAAFEAAVAAWKAYGAGTALRALDGPQLSLVEITLIHAADALGVPFA